MCVCIDLVSFKNKKTLKQMNNPSCFFLLHGGRFITIPLKFLKELLFLILYRGQKMTVDDVAAEMLIRWQIL